MREKKRENLVQARLNEAERARLDQLRRRTGLSDSALVRAALARLAQDELPQGAGA